MTQKPPPRKPELLAPAGNLSTAVTALEAGADAVYAGLGRFNARERADNFSWEDLSRLAAYAKDRDKGYYLTLNTLIKEAELADAASLAASVIPLEPDGVIIQDLGVLKMLRDQFPGLPLHASTQMGLHNSAGLQLASQLGIERVILERQVDIRELEAMAETSPVELEVFIHGALCCSLSGRCLFSSWIGGWSGNRGRCKQPCRRRYHTRKDSSRPTEEDKQSGFFFSPQDLYSLDLIPRYIQAGIRSLKIEGRLKKADSIAQTVEAYRLVLDAPNPADRAVQKEARRILSGAYGRRWSSGFTNEDSRRSLIQPQSLGVSGQLVGEVVSLGKKQAELSLSRPIRRGDRIRFQPRSGAEGPAVTVLQYTDLGPSSRTGGASRKTTRIRIPLPDNKEIDPQALVFRIGESRRETKVNLERLPLYTPAHQAGTVLHLSADRLSLEIRSLDGRTDLPGLPFRWEREIESEPARGKPLDESFLKDLFSATRDSRLRPQFLSVEVEAGLFLPPSRLKQLRRDFWKEASEFLGSWADQPVHPPAAQLNPYKREVPPEAVRETQQNQSPPLLSCRTAAPERLSSGTIHVLPLHQILPQIRKNPDSAVTSLEAELPFFCTEFDLPRLQELLQKVRDAGVRRFRLTAPYQLTFIPRLKQVRGPEELTLTAAFPFPVSNHLTVEILKTRGVHRFQGWIELEQEAALELQKAAPLPMELYRRGKPLLLATRAELPANGTITDSRGKPFLITKPQTGCPWNHHLTCLYPAAPLEIPGLPGTDSYEDLLRLSPKDEPAEPFNWETEWM